MNDHESGERGSAMRRGVAFGVLAATWLVSSQAHAQSHLSVTQTVTVTPSEPGAYVVFRLAYTFTVSYQGQPPQAPNVFVSGVLPHGTVPEAQTGCTLTGLTMTCPVVNGQASIATDAAFEGTVVNNVGAFAYGPGVFLYGQATPLTTTLTAPGPTVTGVSPAAPTQVAPGGLVSITGTYFQESYDLTQVPRVTFGTNAPVNATWGNSTSLTVAAPVTAGTYSVRVTNPDGQSALASQSIVVGSAPPAPTNLVATATTTTQVNVTWGPSTGATSYQLERRGPSEGFHVIASGATLLSFTDNSVTANAAYLYRARAVGSGGLFSPYSNTDVATAILFTDPSLTVGVTVVRAVHITELRTAVNSLRATAGLGASTWTDPSLTGVVVKAVHVQELRTALNEALSALSLSVPAYTDPTLTPRSTTIKKVHIAELRQQVI